MSHEQTQAVEVLQTNLPAPIAEVVKAFPQVSQAEQIAAKYAAVMGLALEIGRKVANLEKGNPEHFELARRARIDLGKVNGAAEKLKKADKEGLLILTRYIDGLYNATVGASKLIQNEADAIEKHFEIMEQQRLEALRAERMAELQPYLDPNGARLMDLATIDADVWPLYLERAKKHFEELEAAKAEAERLRIEGERKAFALEMRKDAMRAAGEFFEWDKLTLETTAAEYEALVQQARERALAHKKAEAERLEAERKAKEEAEAKAEEARKAQAKAEADAKAAQVAKEKAEAEAAKAKAEADAKAQAAQAEADRKAKELQAQIDEQNRKERERLAANAKAEAEAKAAKEAELAKGDADKVQDLINDLEALKAKYVFTSEKYQKMYAQVGVLIDKTVTFITK